MLLSKSIEIYDFSSIFRESQSNEIKECKKEFLDMHISGMFDI